MQPQRSAYQPISCNSAQCRPTTSRDIRIRFSKAVTLCQQIEALRPVDAGILSERRCVAPFGLQGGGNGACGMNLLVKRDGHVVNLGEFKCNKWFTNNFDGRRETRCPCPCRLWHHCSSYASLPGSNDHLHIKLTICGKGRNPSMIEINVMSDVLQQSDTCRTTIQIVTPLSHNVILNFRMPFLASFTAMFRLDLLSCFLSAS